MIGKEYPRLLNEFGDEESAAGGYEHWKQNRKEPHTLFQKIADFFRRIYEKLFKPYLDTFRKISSGKVWEREAKWPKGSWRPKFSKGKKKQTGRPTADEASFTTFYCGFPLPEMVKLGDQWYEASKSVDEASQPHFLRRAAYWYQKALPQLKGFTKTRVEKLLGEVREAAGQR